MRSARSRVAQVFRVLGDDTRLQILALLGVREACVCELVEVLALSQPAVSEHLRRLRDVGLVEDERRGVWVFYRRAAELPDFAAAAMRAMEVPADLVARLDATTAAGACVRTASGAGARSALGVIR